MFIMSALVSAAPASAADQMLGFDINVTLSRKAAARLAAAKEGIVVYVSYYGDPSEEAEKYANDVGLIDLTPKDEMVQISGAGGSAHISGETVDAKRVKWLASPVKVNVNISSARKSGPDNILSCDFIDGPLSRVQKKTVTLHCGLIEEKPSTKLKP